MKKLMLLGALVALVIAGTYFKCKSCSGTGWRGNFKCFVCNGTGKV